MHRCPICGVFCRGCFIEGKTEDGRKRYMFCCEDKKCKDKIKKNIKEILGKDTVMREIQAF